MIGTQDVSKSYAAHPLFEHISIGIADNDRIGMIGPNGSGKSTLLKILAGLESSDSGAVSVTRNTRISYMPQEDVFPSEQSIRDVLLSALKDQHLEHYEKDVEIEIMIDKVGFDNADQRVRTLSGGWRKRLAIASQLIQKPDLVLMDEPTNDLDIPTLEVLEESLLDFPGALVLVTHDRYMLDRVSTHLLALDGQGGSEYYAEYSQWERARENKKAAAVKSRNKTTDPIQATPQEKPKKLSYKEKQELLHMEAHISKAEATLASCQAHMNDESIQTNAAKLQRACQQLHEAQERVDKLYQRWAELGG